MSEDAFDSAEDPAAVLLEQRGEAPERPFPADMPDDLAELVLRQPGLLGSGGDRVALAGMRLPQRRDRLLDLFRSKADLGREVLDRRSAGNLIQYAVENAHRGPPIDRARGPRGRQGKRL